MFVSSLMSATNSMVESYQILDKSRYAESSLSYRFQSHDLTVIAVVSAITGRVFEVTSYETDAAIPSWWVDPEYREVMIEQTMNSNGVVPGWLAAEIKPDAMLIRITKSFGGSSPPIMVSLTNARGKMRRYRDIEREVFSEAVKHSGGLCEGAKSLGLGRSTLYRKLTRVLVKQPEGSRRRLSL